MQASDSGIDDLRSFLRFVRETAAREYLPVCDEMNGHWELAAFTEALVKKMRMPVIEYQHVSNTDMPVVHNVCASLSRIARNKGWSVDELEHRLTAAYEHKIAPIRVDTGPVREQLYVADEVDLRRLPQICYTDTQQQPYLSAAHVVAFDPRSEALNISFHRLMIADRDRMAIYMTPKGHLDQIFQYNLLRGEHTEVAVFIGAHPLWSLGTLAAGSLSLNEFSIIGGLLGYSLPVVTGMRSERLLIPAHAEIAIEGYVSHDQTISEGPYGEAFGFVSDISEQPLLQVTAMSHRRKPIFQDIVPGQLEHMTMTGVAVQVYLRKRLTEQFDCITHVYLPSPMTVHVAVSAAVQQISAKEVLRKILHENRFVKHAVLFDEDIDISNAKQTQSALAMRVQAHRDVIILQGQTGNGLDPSEVDGETTKWGIDASSYGKSSHGSVRNRLPADVVDSLDVAGIMKRAEKNRSA